MEVETASSVGNGSFEHVLHEANVTHIGDSGYADLAAKLVDLKGIARPPLCNGLEKDWPEYKFKMGSVCSLLQLDEVMLEAEQLTTPVDQGTLVETAKEKSKLLFNILACTCSGHASSIVRSVQIGHGLLAWQKLCREFEPALAERHTAMLVGLMTPTWTSSGFLDQLALSLIHI